MTTQIPDAIVEAAAYVVCERCQGNREIVTNWDRYLHPLDGDVGDEAVGECPDCYGTDIPDAIPILPPSPAEDGE